MWDVHRELKTILQQLHAQPAFSVPFAKFDHYYSAAPAPQFAHELLAAVQKMIFKFCEKSNGEQAEALRFFKALELEARQVMTRDVVTCDPDESIDNVMEIMTRGRFRHLPVVRRGELLGLVSIGDVVKSRLEETRHEAEALKAYISAG